MSQTLNTYDILKIDFQIDSDIVSEFSTISSPTAEVVLYLEFDGTYYPNDLGFTTSGSFGYTSISSLVSGDECDHIFSPTLNSKSNFISGDTFGTNPKFRIPIHDIFSSTTTYQLIIPFIKTPSIVNNPLNFKFVAVKYESDQAYPTILMNYDLKNHAFAQTSTATTLTQALTISSSLQATSQTLGVTVSLPSASFISTSFGGIAIRILDGYKSSSFASVTVSPFSKIYFSITNVFLLQPPSITTIASTTAISFGGLSTMDYVSTAYSIESSLYNLFALIGTGSKTSTTIIPLLQQSGSFSKIEGFSNKGSEGLYEVTFVYSPLKIPSLGTIEITLPATLQPITNLGLGDYCQVNNPYNEGSNADSTTNVVFCYQKSTTIYKIQGFGSQGTSVSLSLQMYLKIVSASGSLTISSIWIFGKDLSTAKIISVNAASSLVISTEGFIAFLSITNNFPLYVYANEWGPISFNFKTTTGSLQFANSAKLILTLPTGFSLPSDTATKVYARYGLASGSSFVTVIPTISGQIIAIPIESGYDIPTNMDYKLTIETVFATTNNGIERPDPYLYRFTLEWNDLATLKEIGTYDFKVITKDSTTGNILVFNVINSEKTIMKFKFTPDRNILISDFEIHTEFFTNNGFSVKFLGDLGLGIGTSQNAQEMSCREPLSTTLIAATRISCVLWKGDSTTSISAKLKTPITTAISLGTDIYYYAANIANPSSSDYKAGIAIQVTKKCRDDGLMCIFFQTFVTYESLTTGTSLSYNSDEIFNPSRGITLSASLIYKTSVTHSFEMKFTSSISAGDYLIFIYPKYNLILSDTCTSASGTCMTFPICNWVFLNLAAAIPAISTTVSKDIVIANARYVDAVGTPIYVQAWSATTNSRLDAQQFNHPSYSPFLTTVSRPITLLITPTRTNPLNYWLKNFMNYATLTATGIWYNSEITWFKLVASSGLNYFDSTCNASLTLATPLRNDPYPARFICSVSSTNTIKITKNSNYPFPTYISDFENWQLSINFNFWIITAEVESTITFTLVGSAVANLDTYVSKGTVIINIDPYVQPEFSDLTFNTNSFYDRIGLPGGKVEFYMLLRPSTSPSDYLVNKLVYTIPNDFGYPAIPYLDCEMKGATKYPVTSCQLQRIGGRTLVTLVPSSYSNEVKIVRLTYNAGNTGLFTVPIIGGNNYVLQVDMYTDNQLVERGTANISEIYPGIFNKKEFSLKAIIFFFCRIVRYCWNHNRTWIGCFNFFII